VYTANTPERASDGNAHSMSRTSEAAAGLLTPQLRAFSTQGSKGVVSFSPACAASH